MLAKGTPPTSGLFPEFQTLTLDFQHSPFPHGFNRKQEVGGGVEEIKVSYSTFYLSQSIDVNPQRRKIRYGIKHRAWHRESALSVFLTKMKIPPLASTI